MKRAQCRDWNAQARNDDLCTCLWEKDYEILSQITPQQFGIAADDDNNDVNMTYNTEDLYPWWGGQLPFSLSQLVQNLAIKQAVEEYSDKHGWVYEALDEEQKVDDGVGDGASCDGFGGLYTGEFHRKTGSGRVVASDFRK
ncbi:hypothetical protein L1887_34962 [Cichorium endivia]|nr:hypothetical protein L1887_34962 [Cichorium endivia]